MATINAFEKMAECVLRSQEPKMAMQVGSTGQVEIQLHDERST